MNPFPVQAVNTAVPIKYVNTELSKFDVSVWVCLSTGRELSSLNLLRVTSVFGQMKDTENCLGKNIQQSF